MKILDEGFVCNKAVHIALGVRADGTKEILGLWLYEGARFWLRVITEMKNRGVEDVLLAVVNGLKGLPEAIRSFRKRRSRPPSFICCATAWISFVGKTIHGIVFCSSSPYKDRKPVATAPKAIYRAPDAAAASMSVRTS